MACNRISKRITYKLSFFLFLFFFSILNTTQSLYAEIELFSLSYDDQHGLKINILYNPIYDEEKIKKESLQIKKNEQKISKFEQEIAKKEFLAKKFPLQKAEIRKNIDGKKRLAEKIIFTLQNEYTDVI
jgi:hypothetical protein